MGFWKPIRIGSHAPESLLDVTTWLLWNFKISMPQTNSIIFFSPNLLLLSD